MVEEAQQRKLVEQQLLEREECLRIAINAAGMSAWVMDPVQKNIRVIARTDDWGDVNPSMELHWDQALERVHPDHYPHFELSSLLNDPRQPLLHEGRVKKHDGTWVDTISKGKLVEVPGNPVPQVFAVTMDITELKAIQEKLRQSEMHLRDAQSIANIGSFTWDLQTNQFMWSEELYRIFGKQADEFTPDLEQFLALVSSRERDEVRDTMLRAARECSAFQLEYSFVRQDGSVAYIVMQAKPVAGKHGKVVSFQGTCQDITVRKERERTLRETEMRFRQMADSIEDVFWLFDPIKNRTLYVSPRVVDVWGFTVEDAIDNPLLFLNSVHPEDREKVNQRLVRQGAGEACNDTFRIVKPDGSIRWLHDRTFPVLDAQGRVEQVAGITRDITDQILAEQRLSLQQTQLLHVSRLSTLGMMAATLSHELNQPLSAISNFAAASQALAQDPANFDRVRDNVGQIVRQSIRAGQIVRRVREFATKAAPSREKCEMNSVLEDSCEFVSSQFSHLGVRVEWELLDEPLALAGDPIQLQQLFVNLLTNAADALKDRQPQERIVTIRSRTDGEWVIGEVEDSGDGFTTESLERTFEPFYTTKQRGTGLGLSICQAIAHDHNGEITASHGVRGGARLTVRLPRA